MGYLTGSVYFMQIVERIANITDLNFIYGCILYGARKGHYFVNPDNPEIVNSMKQETQSVVSRQLLLDHRRAQASVFTLNNKRIAILIMSEATLNSSCLEIYALSVASKYQRQGFGSQIVDRLLSHYQYADIYARCSPVSGNMYKLLVSRGFQFHSMDDDYKVLLKETLHSQDFVEPLFGLRSQGDWSHGVA